MPQKVLKKIICIVNLIKDKDNIVIKLAANIKIPSVSFDALFTKYLIKLIIPKILNTTTNTSLVLGTFLNTGRISNTAPTINNKPAVITSVFCLSFMLITTF